MFKTGFGYGNMNEADGNEVEAVRGGEGCGRGVKWGIVLFAGLAAILVVGAVAAVFCLWHNALGERLRGMAGESGFYGEEILGPRLYEKVVDRYRLPALRRPVMFYSQTATDEDLAIVGRAATLLDVQLGAEISDAGLAHLKGLPKLQSLLLNDTGIGDAGLAHLSELTELVVLHLNGTKVTDAGLAHLEGLSKIQNLFLSGTKIGDAGLVHLKKLKNLHFLNLSQTQVTDAGLVHLKSLKGLSYLGLFGTGVTAEGVADLRSAIPGLTVIFK